jgi:hypothetical protein
LGAFFCLRAFSRRFGWKNCHVRIVTDNLTAMLYINRLGGRVESLREVTSRIWSFAHARGVTVSAEYINTLDNKLADRQSRVFENPNVELTLRQDLFQAVQRAFGPLDYDCFAAMENHQLQSYIALRPDPFAIQTDFFSRTAPPGRLYCFPPFNLVLRLLAKLEREGSTALVVLPFWPSRPFWPVMLKMLARCPLTFPADALTHPRGLFRRTAATQFPLIACLVSGNSGERMPFQTIRGASAPTTLTRTRLKATLERCACTNATIRPTSRNKPLLDLVAQPNSPLQVWLTQRSAFGPRES